MRLGCVMEYSVVSVGVVEDGHENVTICPALHDMSSRPYVIAGAACKTSCRQTAEALRHRNS